MMIEVEGGTFRMGTFSGFADERPVHTVTVDSFLLDSHELTQYEWVQLMEENPSYFSSKPAEGEDQDKRPVENVNIYEIMKYCNLRSLSEGLEPCFSLQGKTNPSLWPDIPEHSNLLWDSAICNFEANGYRLPTEAEWEYAARGGKAAAFDTPASAESESSSARSQFEKKFQDATLLNDTTWNTTNSLGKTHQVGLKKPSSLGLYDICGNVWEWCWDWYSCYSSETQVNPHGPEKHTRNADRMGRGGAWNAIATDCTPFFRNCGAPGERFNFLGVRLARSK